MRDQRLNMRDVGKMTHPHCRLRRRLNRRYQQGHHARRQERCTGPRLTQLNQVAHRSCPHSLFRNLAESVSKKPIHTTTTFNKITNHSLLRCPKKFPAKETTRIEIGSLRSAYLQS